MTPSQRMHALRALNRREEIAEGQRTASGPLALLAVALPIITLFVIISILGTRP